LEINQNEAVKAAHHRSIGAPQRRAVAPQPSTKLLSFVFECSAKKVAKQAFTA
jgi:hypothetical protein